MTKKGYFMWEYLSITKDTDRAKKFFENFLAYTTGPYSLNELIKKDVKSFTLIDVRAYEDYIEGHIPFAMHVPFEKIHEHLNLLDREKPTIVYCYEQNCQLAKKASIAFLENYFPTIELEGGFKAWKEHDYEIVKTDAAV